MTTRTHDPALAELRWGQLSIALAIGAFLGFAITATGALLTRQWSLPVVAPTQAMTARTLPPQAEAAELSRRLERAERRAAEHEASLYLLRDDRRWADPEQHDALIGAMRQSVDAMSAQRAAAAELERALAHAR